MTYNILKPAAVYAALAIGAVYGTDKLVDHVNTAAQERTVETETLETTLTKYHDALAKVGFYNNGEGE